LKRVGLALLDQQCFSHGQVKMLFCLLINLFLFKIYVALSRVTKMSGLRVYSPSSAKNDAISNIVYPELLDNT
jgi:hypothetical protein